MAYVPNSGSVVAFQSDATKLTATVSVTGVQPAHSVTALQGTNPWTVSNTSVQVNNIVTGQSSVYLIPGVGVLGSVAVLQGTNPWVISNSSVQVNNIATGNSSVYLIPGIGMLGSITTVQGTSPWRTATSITGGVSSVSQVGNWNMGPSSVQLMDTSASIAVQVNRILQGNSSVQVIGGIGVIGSVAVLQGTNPWVVGNSSVQVNNILTGQSSVYLIPGVGVLGSVATLQGTDPWRVIVPGSVVTVSKDSSVFAALTSSNASVIGVLQGTSIVGTYAEDAGHADGNKGLFILGVRNDTVASFVSANTDYAPIATDSKGRVLTKPQAPVEASIWATASTVNAGDGTNFAASVRLFPAAGAGLKNYITDFLVTNTGASNTMLTFIDIGGSILAKTAAPAGGGSNAVGLATPIVNISTNDVIGIRSQTATSILHVWAAGYKAP